MKTEEMHLLPLCPSHRDTLLILLVFDSVTSSGGINKKIVKAVGFYIRNI
jgi:hypothetical protein